MWATCYTDASFTERASAWAVWLRAEDGRMIRHGPCPPYVHDSTGAELAAIYAGVVLATRRWGRSLEGVWVRSDSRGALDLARPGSKTARVESHRRLQAKLHSLIEARGVAIDCRWVRGHQALAAGTQAYLNRMCDRLAVRERKQAAAAATSPRRRRSRAR